MNAAPAEPVSHRDEGAAEISDDANAARRNSMLSGFGLVSGLTLVSRVLGLVRDAAMAAAFGNGPLLDAFTIAFRIPNLARRLFGEGALAAVFIPRFVSTRESHGTEDAWKLGTAVLLKTGLFLGGVVVAFEFLLVGAILSGWLGPKSELLLTLTAVLLPYLWLICLSAQVAAILQASDRFFWPAALPVVLNVVWVAALAIVGAVALSKEAAITTIAAVISVTGVLQLGLLIRPLHRIGFRLDFDSTPVRSALAAIRTSLVPTLLGLSITQLNTLADGLIAWGLTPSIDDPNATSLVAAGGAAALYFGQRLYQFPLGVFAVAIGTVLYPQISKHATDRNFAAMRSDLTRGMRLVLLVTLPASVGLIVLAEPITALLFERGEFGQRDVLQTSRVVAAYAIAVWAYALLLIAQRGFYATGNERAPLRVGLVAVFLNLILNAGLVIPLGETGLALATAVTAIMQFLLLASIPGTPLRGVFDRSFVAFIARIAVATVVMAVACRIVVVTAGFQSGGNAEGFVAVAIPMLTAIVAYAGVLGVIARRDVLALLTSTRRPRG
ncbi:murein biosynthesis integral membrane protein MurJ [Stratiformator vulcanicus]|uniref:Probable lipid II flippase MurJ n=1 Tax=Stratiformator vulcanicus TaxID=2527980 RepID=A0A517QZV2_9PLAN|nr:murein biosynthesis integral membrane protein MurJ [Stratiformator vulcanicus]QDT37094.1 Lipid II flippase MurJ [Stratiformator vulcanicus]